MNAIKKFWNGNIFNKIILMVVVPIVGICTCCLGGSALASLAPAPIAPTLNPDAVNTVIAETAFASIVQTSAANTPTLVFTATFASTPTLELLTETPTLIPLPTLPTASFSSFTLSASASCVPNTTPQTGKVVHVTDGDTIKVQMDQDGQTYTVRYIGMDTPENTTTLEYYGPESTVKNSELVSGKQVTLYRDVSEIDQYGRLLRYVFVGDTFVNYELVRLGYANAMRYPPDVSCADLFDQTEQTAAASGLGLWAAVPIFSTATVAVSSAPCSCSSNRYNCSDFGTHARAQACFNYCISVGAGDVHRLDSDNNGSACESLP